MLGIFSGKSDHPLADAREARRTLADLVGREPAAALDEVSAWLESLSAADDLKLDLRFELVCQLGDAAASHARRLARDYLTAPRLGRAHEFRLWLANRNYWGQVCHAFERCLGQYEERGKGADAIRAALPRLCARLLNAYAALLKWDQFRYGPIDVRHWAAAGRAYLAADRQKLAKERIALYAGGADSSAEAEYLKALVFSAASMDSMLPLEIEVAERLIAHFLPYFVLTAEARPDHIYWVDAGKAQPPTRLAKLPEISPTLRFFNTGKAVDAVQELLARVRQSGEVPGDINLGGQYSTRIVLPVLEHLAAHWAPKPPTRSHVRHNVKSRLTVIAGLPAICGRLGASGGDADLGEAWIAEDVSLGGMGAVVPLGSNDWIRIGCLVGTQPEGGDNWLVGVIRRFHRETATQGSVGIETISKAPRAMACDSNGLSADGILLDAPGAAGSTVRVALPLAAWEDRFPLAAAIDGRQRHLQPMGMIETGVDFVI